MKSLFLAGNTNWLFELTSVFNQYKNTIHNSTKLTPIQASRKVNEKVVYNNLQNGRVRQQPK